MRADTPSLRFSVPLLCLIAVLGLTAVSTADAETPESPKTLMCVPGDLVFSETFTPDTVSERWGFKADFALRDGALIRTNVNPNLSVGGRLKKRSLISTLASI